MKVIGIDLGTTTSEVAFIKQGNATIIPNIEEANSTVIPSIVLIENDSVKVGIKAKNQMLLKPEKTICEVKRLIGNTEKVKVDSKYYTPTEISSFILKKIKDVAEFFIGEEVTEAVITVPANFNDRQRRETKKAGELAGLKIDRIINEPTAAAIAYGINNLEKNQLILVYDFGGGTFDVSILELYDGVLDVKCSRGNNHLGGKDIDDLMIQMIIDKFYEKSNIKLDRNNKRILSLLKRVAEQGKIDLSTEDSTEIISPYITVMNNEPVDLDIIIGRDEFEIGISNIVEQTEELVAKAVSDANISYGDIDCVIMVGGSTRIPLVRRMLQKKFKDKIISGINPEETIALGAAIQGEIKNGLEKRLIITDASSYTLGVEVINNEFDPIIRRDSKLPVEVTKQYMTAEDNQRFATINIYEGENIDISKNTFITSFELNGLPPAKKGSEKVDITFRYDLNGILGVIATVVSTGESINKKISLEGEMDLLEEVKDDIEIYNVDNGLEKESDRINTNKDLVQDYPKLDEKHISDKDKGSVEVDDCQNSISKDEKKNLEREEKEKIMNIENEVVEESIDEKVVYSDTVSLINYIDSKKAEYPKELQDEVKDKLSQLLTAINQNNFRLARKIQLNIIQLLPDNEDK